MRACARLRVGAGLAAVGAALVAGAPAAAESFVLARSARFGLEVEAQGAAESWCAPELSFRIVAAEPARLAKGEVESFLATAMSKLLAARCPEAVALRLEAGTRSADLFRGEATPADGRWRLVTWVPVRPSGPVRTDAFDPVPLTPAERRQVESLEIVEPAPTPEPSPAVMPAGGGFCGRGSGPGAGLAMGMALLQGAESGDVALPMEVMTALANGGFPLDPPPGGFPRHRIFGEWVQRTGDRTFVMHIDPDGRWRWYRVDPPERDSRGQIRVLGGGTFTLHPSTYPFALCLTYQLPERAGPFLALVGVVDAEPEDETIQLAVLDPGRTSARTQMLLARSERGVCREIYRRLWRFWLDAGLYHRRMRLYYEDVVRKIDALKTQVVLHAEHLALKKNQRDRAEAQSDRAVVSLALKMLETVTLHQHKVAEAVIGAELAVLQETAKRPEERSWLWAIAETINPAFALSNAGIKSLADAIEAWRIGQEYEALRDDPVAKRHARDIEAMQAAYATAMREVYGPYMRSNGPLLEQAGAHRCNRFLTDGPYPSSPYNPTVDVAPRP